jgi:hypothetical protein
MKTWLASRSGVVALSAIALLNFVARSLLDWRYVLPDMADFSGTAALPTAAINVLLAVGWVWAILAAVQGSRRALIALAVLNLVLLVALAVATTLVLCPSPCPTVWPVVEIVNWGNLIFGLLAAFSAWVSWRRLAGESEIAKR